MCTRSISMLWCSWVFEAELCRSQEKSVPLCLLSTAFDVLPVTYKVSNGDGKVLVKNYEDKVLPDTLKWYHTQFMHTKMETFPSFIPLPVLDSETAKRYVQLLVCHSSFPKSCWKFSEHRLWFWWENQWTVKDMNLAPSKDQSCGKFPFLVDFRIHLGFFLFFFPLAVWNCLIILWYKIC